MVCWDSMPIVVNNFIFLCYSIIQKLLKYEVVLAQLELKEFLELDISILGVHMY